MHDEDVYTIDIGDYKYPDTITIPSTGSITLGGNLTLNTGDEVFVKTPDYDSKKLKQELGIDMIQELKRSFGE